MPHERVGSERRADERPFVEFFGRIDGPDAVYSGGLRPRQRADVAGFGLSLRRALLDEICDCRNLNRNAG